MIKEAYRVITDEPQGLCVGFCPTGEGFETEELHLMSDDGGDHVFVDGHQCFIASQDCVLGRYDEPDMLIWRSEAEFNEWRTENVDS